MNSLVFPLNIYTNAEKFLEYGIVDTELSAPYCYIDWFLFLIQSQGLKLYVYIYYAFTVNFWIKFFVI